MGKFNFLKVYNKKMFIFLKPHGKVELKEKLEKNDVEKSSKMKKCRCWPFWS